MISRRGLIVAGAGGLGVSDRRPDQHYGAPAPGLVPGSRTGNLRARSLVLFGTGNGVGLFEYSGTPSLGNNPVAYAVPPGVTKDPFGNTLPVSNGFVTVDNGLGILSRLTGNTLQFRSTGTPPNSPPAISGPDASPTGTLLTLASGQGTAGATASNMQLFDSLQDAVQGGTGVPQIVVNSGAFVNPLTSALLDLQGSLGLKGIAAPAAPPAGSAIQFADTSGFLRMLTGLAGDTSSYLAAYLMLSATATPQTISSTIATTITGCSAPVASARYAFKARVAFHGASASGTANFSVTGPAVTSQWITATFAGTGAVGVGFQNTALGPVNSFTQTTTEMMADIEGEGTFTASGTIALACAMSSGGANVIIDRAHFWLFPLA